MSAGPPGACHATKKEPKTKAKTGPQKRSKINETSSCFSFSQRLALHTPKKHQNGLPEPPREPPGTAPGAPRRPQEAPRAAQDGPKRRQEGLKSRPKAVSERPFLPLGAELAPKRAPEASRRRFGSPPGPILEPPGDDFGPSGAAFCKELIRVFLH